MTSGRLNMEKIQSVKNQKIKNLRKLHTTKGRKEARLYLIEGEHLYLAALQNQIELKEIIITEKFINQVTETTAIVTLVPDEVMQALSQTETAPGIICVLEIPAEPVLNELKGKFVLLDGVQDPGNAGTIVRTADAAGFDGVIFGSGSVDPYNDKVMRSMQGSHFHIPLYRTELVPFIDAYIEKGFPVYGTALQRAIDYRGSESSDSLAIILGNEGQGVSEKVLAKTTQNLYIPIIGKAESLNVAVAAGILIYHFANI